MFEIIETLALIASLLCKCHCEYYNLLFGLQVMLDTVGAELQVVNKSEKAISLKSDASVVLTPDQGQEASSELLPINFNGLSKVPHVLFNVASLLYNVVIYTCNMPLHTYDIIFL